MIPEPGRTVPVTAPVTAPVTVRVAEDGDFPGFLRLAAEVEHWFGPMVEEPGFHEALRGHLRRGAALLAADAAEQPLGGLLFGSRPPRHHVHWLVVAGPARGRGVGRALLDDAVRRFVRGPGTLEVVTFGADHPGAVASGARAFYERLGFTPAEPTDPGPEGGSRQVFRRTTG